METISSFALHPVLARDGLPVAQMAACQLLLMNDSRYPWLILVPTQGGLKDLDDLPPAMVPLVWSDISRASQVLRHLFQPDKINVAALGNMVPQLHIHVIARFQTDPAWPQPIWGKFPPLPYEPTVGEERVKGLVEGFNSLIDNPRATTQAI